MKLPPPFRSRKAVVALCLAAVVAGALWHSHLPAPSATTSRSNPPRATAPPPADAADATSARPESAPVAVAPTPPALPPLSHVRDAFDRFDTWLAQHVAGQSPLLADGIGFARDRRALLKDLIVTDPREALSRAVSRAARATLPAEILRELETPIDATAAFEVFAGCFGGQLHLERFVVTAKQRYRAHTFGTRLAAVSKHAMPIHGIAIEDQLAVSDAPFRRLEAAELGAASSDPRLFVAVGADVQSFSTESELAAWQQRVTAAEAAPGPDAQLTGPQVAAATADWTHGEKRVLWIRLDFPDDTTLPASDAAIRDAMTTVNQFFQALSRGRTSIQTTLIPGALRLPQPKSYYSANGGRSSELHTEALRLAREYDAANGNSGAHHPDRFDRVVIHFRRISTFAWAGLAQIGGKATWLNESISAGVIAHELGHNHGLYHAHAWKPRESVVTGPGEHLEYGDPFDVMGDAGAIPAGHFNGHSKDLLLYLGSTEVTTVTASGRYRLHRHDDSRASGVQGLRIAAGPYEYFVEHRRQSPRSGFSHGPRLESGILIRWSKYPDTHSGSGTYLLDATPGGTGTLDDAAYGANQTFVDARRGLQITAVASGGSTPNEWVDVQVDFGATGSNRNPVLTAAAPLPVVPARTDVTLRATASDPDNDPVSYIWEIGGEEFLTTAPTLVYRWPGAGTYTVRCNALDGRGGFTSQTFTVTVDDVLSTWTRRGQGVATSSYYAALHARDQFIVVGNGIATSPDGITWTRRNLTSGHLYDDVVFGQNIHVAVGGRFNSADRTTSAAIGRSVDGHTWTDATPAGATLPELNGVAFGAGRFAAVGADGLMLQSADGTTWTRVTTEATQTLYSVRYAAGQFVAVGLGGVILMSSDGLQWRLHRLADPYQLVVVTHFRNAWFVSGQGRRWLSTDSGATWVSDAITGRPLLHRLARTSQPELLLASQVAFDDIYVSEDGQRWSALPVKLPRTANFQWGIAEANGTVVIAGRDGLIYQSTVQSASPSTPVITSPPRTESFATGQPLILTVAATGGGLNYQWHRDGVAISEATGSTLSIPKASTAHAGNYTVTITNLVGSVTSAAASVVIENRTVYIAQMAASRSVTAGTDLTLAVTAGGRAPLTYQWQKDGVDLPGASGSSLALGLAGPTTAGRYTVTVTDAGGTVTSSPAVITVTGEPPYQFFTHAGRRAAGGSTDGTGSAATFGSLAGIAIDAAGYVYVSDTTNNTIRKISPAGEVITWAGQAGIRGTTDGPRLNALFAFPQGLALDRGGNLFVADTNNNAIRRITPEGTVSTFAGRPGFQGTVDGAGVDARLALPTAIVVAPDGNIYFTETLSSTVRKITPAGNVTTFAGQVRVSGPADGTGTQAQFNAPRGLAVDRAGTLYVADTGNGTIRKITPQGVVSTIPAVDGAASNRGGVVGFVGPGGIAVDADGNVFVTTEGSAIRRIDPDGFTTIVGGQSGIRTVVDGIAPQVRIASGNGLAFDSLGTLYFTDADMVRRAALVGLRTGARLANLSVRSFAGTDADTLIVGFSIGGGSKSLLVRAVGPTLGVLGVEGAIANPTLQLDNATGTFARNDDWHAPQNGDAATLVNAAAQVGAFPLPAQSRDAALLQPLATGSYTAQVGGGTGVALVELYDASTARAARLANVSARTRAGTGNDTLIVGFVVTGDAPRTVLIRAIGPTLASFGVGGALANPRLDLHRDSMLVAPNSGWGGSAALTAVFNRVGAFPLAAESRDAALLLTLLPGAYTAQVTPAAGPAGAALVEIYDVQ